MFVDGLPSRIRCHRAASSLLDAIILPYVEYCLAGNLTAMVAIRAPRGPELSCKGWAQGVALRMLMNNGMGGAQPLAVTMNDGVAPVVEVDRVIWARRVHSGEWPILNVLVSTMASATWVGVDPMSVAGHAG